MTLDEAIAKAKADGDVQLAEWLRQARGADAAARWYTEKLRELESENASLRGAVQGLGRLCDDYKAENAKLRELAKKLFKLADRGLMELGDDDFRRIVDEAEKLGIEVDE